MRVIPLTLVLLQALFFAQCSHAFDKAEQRYVDQLVSNDVSQIRGAAQEIHRARMFDQKLLDVVAEVILETYAEPPSGFIQVDALSWSTNALGASGDGRYRSVLEEVEKNAYHKKLRKFAKKNRRNLNKGDVAQYKKGNVSLKALRK